MSKVRKVMSRRPGEFDHPDGGTFYVFPFDETRAVDFGDLQQDWKDAAVKSGQQYRQLADFVADNVVDRITNFEDAETNAPLESTREVIIHLLMLISDREENGKPLNEPGFVWALACANELYTKRKAALGNS
jgi:hypothetical protein